MTTTESLAVSTEIARLDAIRAGEAEMQAIIAGAMEDPAVFMAGVEARNVLIDHEAKSLPLGQFLTGSSISGADRTAVVKLGFLDPYANPRMSRIFNLGYQSGFIIPLESIDMPIPEGTVKVREDLL